MTYDDLELFNPSQARDAKGKWTKGGAFLGGSRKEIAANLQAKVPGLSKGVAHKMSMINDGSDNSKVFVPKSAGAATIAKIQKAFPDKTVESMYAKTYIANKQKALAKAPAGTGVGKAKPKPKPPIGDDLPDSKDLTVKKTLGGSTGAKLAEGPDGKQYVLKKGGSKEHITEEHTAEQMYTALGVAIPKSKLDANGTKVSEFIDGTELGKLSGPQKAAAIKELNKGVAADALMANWDVVGLGQDNVIVGKNGIPQRIDVGGSLRYRAQGAPKGDKFGDHPTELWTLREKSPSILGTVDTDHLYGAQIDGIVSKKIAVLAATKDPALKKTMENRINNMQFAATDYKALRASGYSAHEADGIVQSRMLIAQKNGKSYLSAATGEPGAYHSKGGVESVTSVVKGPKGGAKTPKKKKATPVSKDVGHDKLPSSWKKTKQTPMEDQVNKKWNTYSAEEQKTLRNYSSNGYKFVNKPMINCAKPDPADCLDASGKRTFVGVMSAIQKAGKQETPITTFHMAKSSDAAKISKMKAQLDTALETGGTFTRVGLTSTSLSKTVAREFSLGTDPGRNVMLTFKSRTGVYIGRKSSVSHEKEFILPHGGKYRVVGKGTSSLYGNTITEYFLEEVEDE